MRAVTFIAPERERREGRPRRRPGRATVLGIADRNSFIAAEARLLALGDAPGSFGIMVLIFEPLMRRLMDGREELWCHIGWSGGA